MAEAEKGNMEVDYNSFPLFVREESTDYLFGEDNAWVSDIWAFWDFLLRKHKARVLNDVDKKYLFLQSLLEQAKYFFQAAETAPIKSQPLLYYYSFMNLAKIVINICVADGESSWMNKEYKHGLQEKTGTQSSLEDSTITLKTGSEYTNIAPVLMGVLGDNTDENATYSVKELLSSCLGIHRAYSQTYNSNETFFRVDNPKTTTECGTIQFQASIHDCTEESLQDLNKYYQNIKLKDCKDKNGNTYQDYIWEERTADTKPLIDLANLLRNKGIWGLTDGKEVSLYISTSSVRLSTESIIYMLMYFFGSITRYRPYVFEELLSDENRWLMCEFLKTQPKQFIYLVTYRVLGRNIRQSWMTKL